MHVYAITNTANGKIYIGQHAGDDLLEYLRLNLKRSVSNRRNDKPLLYRAMRKHGAGAFVINSLVLAMDKQQVNELEKFFIRTLDARDPEVGYNLAEGGTGGATRWGHIKSPGELEKLRKSLMGVPKSIEHRKSLSIAKTGIPNPAIVESNIRRRSENPSLAALRNREYRIRKKAKGASHA